MNKKSKFRERNQCINCGSSDLKVLFGLKMLLGENLLFLISKMKNGFLYVVINVLRHFTNVF